MCSHLVSATPAALPTVQALKNSDDDGTLGRASHGVLVGPLQAHLHDRIKVGDVVLLLTDGATCNYPIGTVLRVTYREYDGIKEASRVARTEW